MLADVGYALSAAGYGLLLLLLFAVRKSGLAKYLLILATAVTAVWAASQITVFFGTLTAGKVLLVDSAKQLAWMVFLLSCTKDNFQNLGQVLRQPIAWAMLAVPVATLVLPFFYAIDPTWRYLGQTVVALEGLILLELIYRQAGENRWAFKPLILFLGATNLFEFVTYANATMVDRLDEPYIAARGIIYAVLLPFLVFAIRRIKHWGVDIFVSREVVLHSSLLMVAGGYLFIMALAGYAVRYIGGEWGSTVQIALIVLSLALLATLFLSNSFRIRVKVFITKHFFANQFDYRIEWVRLTEALKASDGSLQQVYDNALKGILQAIDYDEGLLVKRKHGAYMQTMASVEHDELTRPEQQLLKIISDFCEKKNWLVDLEELRYKPFVYEGLKVNHALLNECSFQLVLPIYQSNRLWGLALLRSNHTARRLNWEIRDYLSAITAQVSSYVLLNEASQEVAENAQFAAFSRMSAFVVHDLKNVLAQIDLILCNAQQHKNNPEFIDDTFETLEHTKSRMENMLRQLTDKNAAQQASENLTSASEIINHIVERKCAGHLPAPLLEVKAEKQLVIDSEKFGNVMYHLISNAQQATDDNGDIRIVIDTNAEETQLNIDIIDTGIGMSRDFIENRLFKPFDTTKGNAGMGIGAYDAKNFMEKIGGHLDVKSVEREGTTFTLTLPLE